MSRARKYLIGFSAFLVLYAAIGFFVLPPVIKSVATRTLSEQLHREVAIGKIKVNPFTFSIRLRNFTIRDRDGSVMFVSLDRVYLNFKVISLLKRGLIFSAVKIERPYLHLVRNEDQTYNFSDLLERRAPEKGSKALRFSLNNVQISQGSVDFLDTPNDKTHTVRDISIAIPFLSNFPYHLDRYVKPAFAAVVNGHPVSLEGETKPFKDSRETVFEVDIKDFDLPYYIAYVPFKMDFKVLSGFMDTKAKVSYREYRNRPPAVDISGLISFRTVKVVDSGDRPLLSLPLLGLSLSSTDLMLRKIDLSAISLQSPEIDLARDGSGTWNIDALLPPKPVMKEDKSAGDSKKGEEPKFTLNADVISVTGGKVSFSDGAVEGFRTDLKDIAIKIEHFSTQQGRRAAVQAAFNTEAGESLTARGWVSAAPVSSAGSVEIKKIALKKYAPYYKKNVLFDVRRGELEVMTQYDFVMSDKDPVMRLSGLSAVLSSLRARKRDEKEDFLDIPVVAVKAADVDAVKKEIVVGDLSTHKGALRIKRAPERGVNIASLTAPAEGTREEPSNPRQEGPAKPWNITFKKVEASGYTVSLDDRTTPDPVALRAERIKLSGEGISTKKNSKGKVSFAFRIGKKGSFSSRGTVGIEPAVLTLKVNAKDFDITPLQPYFTDRVKILVTGGSFSSQGTFTLGYQKETGAKAGYKGEAHLARFASLDKAKAEDFLKWDSLYVKGIDAGYNPLRVKIDEIALADFYSRVIVNADGTLNLQDIFEKGGGEGGEGAKEEPSAESREEPTAKKVEIDRVTLQGGTINFSDNHITPNFFANMKEIGGRISGLSSEEDKFADVDLKGKLEDYAPLEITGKINPLREDLFVDLKIDFKDMDMSSLNPYARRYVGYTIQKGQLSLDLQYLIVKRKLDSKNNITFDQLSLGDKVDSPEATKLPVKLAVALLKNRKGEINLDVPVSGSIDDPNFRLGKVILKVLVNILVKAATSPFALLGALFGGGEELGYIQFDYGSYALDEGAAKKLDTLIKALQERPALKLEIIGYVDTEKDREGLRQYLFHKKIKAQKLKEMLRKGVAPVPVDDITIEKDEYPKYLKAAYKAEDFIKPRNFLGIAKSLPAPEMEKLMLTHIVVSDEDLKKLASERALTVKEYLLKSQAVAAERVFLLEAGTLHPEKKENLKDSRVEFRLE